MRGFLLKYDSKTEGYVIDRALKKPIYLDPEETTLYYLYYGYMLWELHRTEALTEEILRLLESSIQLARSSSIYAETLIRSPEHLLESPYEILYSFWEAMQGNSSELVIISDNLKEPQYAVYTNSLPPFRYITELEATQLVTCFLEKAFNGLVPGKYYNQNFIQSFKDFLVSKKGISTEVFNERISLVGVPFKNGFACIKNEAERPELLEYSHSTFVTSEINKLQLQPRFLTFLVENNCPINFYTLAQQCLNDPAFFTELRLKGENVFYKELLYFIASFYNILGLENFKIAQQTMPSAAAELNFQIEKVLCSLCFINSTTSNNTKFYV